MSKGGGDEPTVSWSAPIGDRETRRNRTWLFVFFILFDFYLLPFVYRETWIFSGREERKIYDRKREKEKWFLAKTDKFVYNRVASRRAVMIFRYARERDFDFCVILFPPVATRYYYYPSDFLQYILSTLFITVRQLLFLVVYF